MMNLKYFHKRLGSPHENPPFITLRDLFTFCSAVEYYIDSYITYGSSKNIRFKQTYLCNVKTASKVNERI